MKGPWAFFAHFNRINMQRGLKKVWTVHFKGRCIQAEDVYFAVPIHTRFLPEGRQPRATMRGVAERVHFVNKTLVVE